MKAFLKLLLVTLLISNSSKAQLPIYPTYDLGVRNFQLRDTLGGVDNVLYFDIVILHTNLSNSGPFYFVSGGYYFEFNPEIANGGILSYKIIPGSSDFTIPACAIPRFPTINGTQLRLEHPPQICTGTPPTVNTIFPGTRVVKMSLVTTAISFATVPLNLRWRTLSDGNPYTRIYASIITTPTDVTNYGTKYIDSSGLGGVLPVELSNFISNVNKNTVTLNWTTIREANNSGFDIERKLSTSTQWSKSGSAAGNGSSNKIKNYTLSEKINSGKYNYRLKQIDYNGNFEYFNLSDEVIVGVPAAYSISQNYPNPFNPTTKIDYEISQDAVVQIKVYDVSGKELFELVNEVKDAGYYTVQFNARNLASGTYFYRLLVSTKNLLNAERNNDDVLLTRKLNIVK